MGIFFVVLIACVCVFCACFFQGCGKKPLPVINTFTPTTVESVKNMSKTEVEAMLKELAIKKAPPIVHGAMCYAVALASSHAEYVCPVCGEKTIYASDDGRFINDQLENVRTAFEGLKRVTKPQMEFDESSFCKKCHPETKKPAFVLTVIYDDGTIVKTSGINSEDLNILAVFFNGDVSIGDGRGGSRPLKEQLPRLRELLGMKKEEVK